MQGAAYSIIMMQAGMPWVGLATRRATKMLRRAHMYVTKHLSPHFPHRPLHLQL